MYLVEQFLKFSKRMKMKLLKNCVVRSENSWNTYLPIHNITVAYKHLRLYPSHTCCTGNMNSAGESRISVNGSVHRQQ